MFYPIGQKQTDIEIKPITSTELQEIIADVNTTNPEPEKTYRYDKTSYDFES